MSARQILLLTLVLILPYALSAQSTSGGAGGANSGGNTGGNTGGGRTPTNPGTGGGRSNGGNQGGFDPRQQQPQQMPDRRMQRPIFLSGSVVLSSGGPPAEPIKIVRVCGMRKTPEGYTNSKGHFNFQVGANASIGVMDASIGSADLGGRGGMGGDPFGNNSAGGFASAGGSMNEIDLSGCTLEVDAPGFRANSIMLHRMRSMDRSEVGTFVLTPLGGSTGSVVSATSFAAPKKARSMFDKALKELGKGPNASTDKAVRGLEGAVALYPEYAAAWTVLGQTKAEAGDTDGALVALENAVQADPRYLRPYSALTRLNIEAGNWERTIELANFVLGANPANTEMRWYRAIAEFESDNYDGAISSLIELQSDAESEALYPQSHQVLGKIYSERGQFSDAATAYRRYLELAPNGSAGDAVKRTLHEWEQLGVI